MTEINSLLASLGLSRFQDNFIEQEIESADLGELNDEDLKAIGLPLGPRRRLLKAIRDASEQADDHTLLAEAVGRANRREHIAERRQLTVMFIDLVGSTRLSQELDPEDLADVMQTFNETCARTVTEFGGYVANHMGDGLMVLFGFPRANEDGAERAIRAGLKVLRNVHGITTHSKLTVRVGVATGLVVVGELTGLRDANDVTAMGEAVNLAARLQSMADPGTLIVAPSSRQLAGNAFEFTEKGAIVLKGFSEPVLAWQVTGVNESISRFRTAEKSDLRPMAGRREELSSLNEKWELARQGRGQVVLISGEPGIGKSRIVEEMLRSVEGDQFEQILLQCSAYHETSALYPAIRYLEHRLGFASQDSVSERLQRLTVFLKDTDITGVKCVASLLSVPFEDELGELDLTPQQMLEKAFEQLKGIFLDRNEQRPCLLIVEDAHWADPTTKSLLDEIISGVEELPALVVLTFRPGFDPGWVLRPNLTHTRLTPLEFNQVEEIAVGVACGKRLPAEVCNLVAARTNGVPLYVEEVTKDILESGFLEEREDAYVLSDDLPVLAVPSTLQDFLMSRLDRLGRARETAQIGSVFGVSFTRSHLLSVSEKSESELELDTEKLLDAGIILRSNTNAGDLYTFRHALVRDTAYNSLLKSERQALHGQIARQLDGASSGIAAGPEIIAHHYTIAKQPHLAWEYWFAAGKNAVKRSASKEARQQLSMALGQLEKLPQNLERDAKEIEVQVLRASVLRSTAGIAADKTGQTYKRIRHLCDKTGDTSHLFPVLNGQYSFYLVRADYDKAREVADELLGLGRQTGVTEHKMVAHRAMGAVLLHIGRVTEARNHLEEALRLYKPEKHAKLAYVYGTDHAAITSSFLSFAVWMCGAPDRALDIQEKAVSAAIELDHAYSVSQALTYLCMLHVLRRDTEKTIETACKLDALASEHSFSFLKLTANFWRRWAEAYKNPSAETLRLLQMAAEGYWSEGAGNYKPYFLTLIAEVALATGESETAASLSEEALDYMQVTNERWAQAETERVRALALRRPDHATHDLEGALSVARAQKAIMFELRAAIDAVMVESDHSRKSHLAEKVKALVGSVEGGKGTADVQLALQSI